MRYTVNRGNPQHICFTLSKEVYELLKTLSQKHGLNKSVIAEIGIVAFFLFRHRFAINFERKVLNSKYEVIFYEKGGEID